MPSFIGQDPSVLLQGRGIQVPDQLDLAGKGATLAKIMQQVQIEGLDLQQRQGMVKLYSDPNMLSALTSALTGQPVQGGAAGGAPGTSTDAAGNPTPDIATTLRNASNDPAIAAALPAFVKGLQDFQKTGAEIGEKRAQAGKLTQDTKIAGINAVGNQANGLLVKLQDGQPVTQQDLNLLQMQMAQLNTPPSLISAMPGADDAQALGGYLSSLTSAAVDPAKRWDIWKVQQETPVDVRRGTAQAVLDETNAKLRPREVAAREMEARAAASNAAKGWAEAGAPTFVPNPQGGGGSWVTRGIQPGGNVAPNVTTAVDANGNPVKVGPSLTEAEFAKGGADIINKAAPQVQTASELQQQIMRLKALDQSGIYSGPLGASKFWKDLTGTLAPMMSPEDRARVENSQAFNAEANTIVGKYMQSIMGGRMSRGALTFGGGTKPSDVMQPGARDTLYDSMFNGAQRTIDYWKQAGQFAAQNPGAPLTSFAPQYSPDVKLTAAGPIQAGALKPPTPEETFNARAAMREAAKRGMDTATARSRIQTEAIRKGFDPSGLGI